MKKQYKLKETIRKNHFYISDERIIRPVILSRLGSTYIGSSNYIVSGETGSGITKPKKINMRKAPIKKTCGIPYLLKYGRCKALICESNPFGASCELGYKQIIDSNNCIVRPAEPCPKPLTNKQLVISNKKWEWKKL